MKSCNAIKQTNVMFCIISIRCFRQRLSPDNLQIAKLIITNKIRHSSIKGTAPFLLLEYIFNNDP